MNPENKKSASVSLLSAVPPPSELPNYILNQSSAAGGEQESKPEPSIPFSAAIPPSLSQNFYPVEQQDTSAATASPPQNTSDFTKLSLNPEPVSNALNPLTQLASAATGSTLLGWVKGAADVSGGLLQKIGEKAMSSMDTLVTTLDPQMKDYIRSGGDVEILIASHKEDKVRPIREAFQLVFGRATLMGVQMDPLQSNIAAQPVGFAAALKGCQERIQQVRMGNNVGNKLPVIALENCIVEIFPEHWFDVGLIVLDEPDQNIFLQTFTQMTPIPASVAVSLASDTPAEYPFRDSGYSVTVGQVMGANLNIAHTDWHSHCGTKRSEFIYLAAKTLATLYKNIMDTQDKSYGTKDEVPASSPSAP